MKTPCLSVSISSDLNLSMIPLSTLPNVETMAFLFLLGMI